VGGGTQLVYRIRGWRAPPPAGHDLPRSHRETKRKCRASTRFHESADGQGHTCRRCYLRHRTGCRLAGRRRECRPRRAWTTSRARRAGLRDIISAGGRAVFTPCDATREGDVAAAVALAIDRFGHLDGAVNKAGGMLAAGPLADLSAADWQAELDLNLNSAFFGLKHQIAAIHASGGGAHYQQRLHRRRLSRAWTRSLQRGQTRSGRAHQVGGIGMGRPPSPR
jgi:NAD(P)-dependent dehydrogenase (short-subunit alcohol dehydrogenase family)